MRWIRTPVTIAGFLLAAVCMASAQETDRDPGLPERFSVRLNQIESRLREIDAEIRSLPAMSDIDARGTHGFHSNFSAKSEEHWFEIRWENPRRIDGIGMIPTRITTQSGLRSNYGFPVSLRVMATRSGSEVPFVLATVADTRLDLRRGEPLFLNFKAESLPAGWLPFTH